MKLGELIGALGGKLAAGSAETRLTAVADSETAGERELTFAEDAGAAELALGGGAGAVVVKTGLAGGLRAGRAGKRAIAIVECEQPRLWFARAAQMMRRAETAGGVHPAAVVGAGVELGAEVSIGACAVIGAGARIGDGTRVDAGAVIGAGVVVGAKCHVYPRAVVYSGTTLDDRVVVHAGAVLGADGFGYVRDAKSGAYTQFPQQGTLHIEDDVEIGANSTVDRGALRETRVGRGTKIDNLVHVGHNCEIGEDVILVALTGISGSSTVGDGAVIAGQVGIGDHAHVGPGVILGGQSGVFNGKTVTNEGLRPGTVLFGTPARPLRQVMREQAVLARLAKKTGNRE